MIDTGAGFSESEHADILLPFRRGTKDSFVAAGAGLGLSIVKRLTDMIGAELQISSMLGKGSRFRVTFVAKKAAV